jgi:hypothetical protein
LCPSQFSSILTLLSHQCLGTAAGFFRTLFVNLLGSLRRIGQDGHVIGSHLYGAATDGNELIFLTFPANDQFPVGQRSYERGMMWEYA